MILQLCHLLDSVEMPTLQRVMHTTDQVIAILPFSIIAKKMKTCTLSLIQFTRVPKVSSITLYSNKISKQNALVKD
jgi:hypothetical protein